MNQLENINMIDNPTSSILILYKEILKNRDNNNSAMTLRNPKRITTEKTVKAKL